MEWSRRAARIGLALTVVLLPLGSLASAGPKEDVSAATSEWGRVLGEDDPDKVLPLYADDAVLWGTLSPMVRSDRAAFRDYFVTAFRVLPGLKVTFGDQLIRVANRHGYDALVVERQCIAMSRYALARPAQGEASARTAYSGLRLVFRRVRHARSEGGEGVARGVGGVSLSGIRASHGRSGQAKGCASGDGRIGVLPY